MRAAIKNYYNQYIIPEVGIKCRIAGIMLIVGAMMFLLNSVVLHYHGQMQFGLMLIKFLPVYLLIFAVSLYIKKECPRLSLFFHTLGELCFVGILIQFLVTMAQFTPFHSFDAVFNRMDVALGYHLDRVLQWVYQHPRIYWFSQFVYTKLYYELMFTPILLAILGARRSIDIFFITSLLTALIGFTLYFFFPSTDPAAVIHNVAFQPLEYSVVTQFQQLHHQQVMTHYVGGIVGFPSFHVMWALIVIYAWRKYPAIFIPILFLNGGIILSTLLLGWHYLVDVLAAMLIFSVATYLANRWSAQTT